MNRPISKGDHNQQSPTGRSLSISAERIRDGDERVMNDLLIAADENVLSLLLSLDISPAFDTVNHMQLLNHEKELCGFGNTILCWLPSYLSERVQFVSMAGWMSLICDYNNFRSSTRISTWAVVILHLHDARR